MKKNMPLVSIIMSEYNTNKKLLIESIQSLLNQTYNNFEIILIDDCGENDVNDVIKIFNDKRIKVFRNENNSGLVYSLNKAIKLSSGQYIARMDTDDYSYPDRIEKQVDFMIKNPKYDVIGTKCYYYDGQNIWGKSNFSGEITKEVMLNGTPLIHPSVMYKKSIMEKNGGYLNYKRCEDTATWIDLFSKGYKMYVLDDALVRYHLDKNDYKKRSLKNRKDSFRLLNEIYIKLNPSKSLFIKKKIKLFLSCILPHSLLFKYHKNKFRERNN